MRHCLANTVILSGGQRIVDKAVLIQEGRITNIIPDDQIPADVSVIDLHGAFLAPGLIDLQVYGSGGKLFGGDPSEDALAQMEADFHEQGTTGFLATVATNASEVVERAIVAAKNYRKHTNGSFLGLHLEGPYLNSTRRGAHPEKFIKKGSLDEVRHWLSSAEGEIRMMTLAPELQDHELLCFLAREGVILSCGHSDATFEQANGFFGKPVHAATHLYNAMPPMHHRQPGLIPAIFEKQPFTSVVADGIHVSFAMIALAKKLLGDRLFLITDAVTATDRGTYPHVFAQDRYTMPDGTLSGSCLTMLQAVRNCVECAGITLEEAVNMASLYPARLLGTDGETGKVETGYLAELLVFDARYQVQGVITRNKTVIKF